ncbi:GNAT family N-acetyltransferase [Streptomyces atratus]|uniref:GNAT family N-acetyltransferase n=1 Tax=Streptomyces atratus TaxID=1893 RepID=UPI0033C51F71
MRDLVTPRLVLHPLSPAEAENVVARRPGPGGLWAPEYPTDGDANGARHFLEHCADTGNPQPFGPYEIRLRQNGHAVGGVGFHGAPNAEGQVTIGYGLTSAVRGKGYASEALRALLEFARDEGIAAVNGDADLDNTASHHVMVAAGMHFVREDDRVKHFRIDWSEATEATYLTRATDATDAA